MTTATLPRCDVCGYRQPWLSSKLFGADLCQCSGCEKTLCVDCGHGEERMCRECIEREHREEYEDRQKEQAQVMRGLPARVKVLEYRVGQLAKGDS